LATDEMTRVMLEIARLSFDNGMKNLELCQQQAERAVDLALSNGQAVRDETRQATRNWLAQVRKVCESYAAAVEAGLRMLERQAAAAKPADEERGEPLRGGP